MYRSDLSTSANKTMKKVLRKDEHIGYTIGKNIEINGNFYASDSWFLTVNKLGIEHELLCKKTCTEEEIARYVHLFLNKKLLYLESLIRETNHYTTSASPIITSEYQNHHFDDYPILYIGRNFVGKLIIGSFIEEDEENKGLVRYLQSVVSEQQYQTFLNREITYLQVLENALHIYILIKDQKENVLLSNEIKFTELVDEYLPSKESYCPILITK